MAAPIDDRIIDTPSLCDIPLETHHEFQPYSPEPWDSPYFYLGQNVCNTLPESSWENLIDFDGNQAHPVDGQSPFPGNKINNESPSSNESNIEPAALAYEHVYPSQVPVKDLPWDKDSDFDNAEENNTSQQSHLAIYSPSMNTNGQTPEISDGDFADSEPRISSRKRHRFSKKALALLWKSFHRKPYPTEEVREDLAQTTGGTKKQISTWFGNARRRAVPKSTDHVPIPPQFPTAGSTGQRGQSPLQRYLNSPPEDDPVPIARITAAASQQFQIIDKKRNSSSVNDVDRNDVISRIGLEKCSSVDTYAVSDEYSCEPTSDRGYDSISMSGISNGSAASNSSHVSHASWAGRRGRKRFKTEQDLPQLTHPRERQANHTFQCTWCYRGFNRKDSWKRHEESEHCPQKEYVCMLDGYTMTDHSGLTRCVFCYSSDVSEEHLGLHKVKECYQRAEAERSFARSDLLTQHIQQKHRSDLRNTILARDFYRLTSSWQRPFCSAAQAGWLCGFCQLKFTDWGPRCQHVAQHFIAGEDMTNWD